MIDSVYAVWCYNELVGLYTTQDKAETRIKALAAHWGDEDGFITWQYIPLDSVVASNYDIVGA